MIDNTKNTNLEFIKVSRKKPEVGDIFAFKNKYLGWIYGRVIKMGGPMGDHDSNFLVYIYNNFSKDLELHPKLNKNDLLIPPYFINRLGWLKGYFQTISKITLDKEDILDYHSFIKLPVSHNLGYVDEYGNKTEKINKESESYAMGNYITLDMDISKKFNLPSDIK